MEETIGHEEIFDNFIQKLRSHSPPSALPKSIKESLRVVCQDNFNKYAAFMERLIIQDSQNAEWWDLYLGYAQEYANSTINPYMTINEKEELEPREVIEGDNNSNNNNMNNINNKNNNNINIIEERIISRAVKHVGTDVRYKIKWIRILERRGNSYEEIHRFIKGGLRIGEDDLQYQYLLRKELCEVSARMLTETDISIYNKPLEVDNSYKHKIIEEEEEEEEEEEDKKQIINTCEEIKQPTEIIEIERSTIPKSICPIERMRANYNSAIQFLSQPNPNYITSLRRDLHAKLSLNRAEIEAYKIHDQTATISIMEPYIKSHSTQHLAWLNYIKFARALPNPNLMRTLCKRGLHLANEFEIIAKAWIDWEKMYLYIYIYIYI